MVTGILVAVVLHEAFESRTFCVFGAEPQHVLKDEGPPCDRSGRVDQKSRGLTGLGQFENRVPSKLRFAKRDALLQGEHLYLPYERIRHAIKNCAAYSSTVALIRRSMKAQ